MPIQLDKILADIAEEKVLHPSNRDATKKDIDEAWVRVGKNNKLSVHETRSIFKVLQKKYEQEKEKGTSAWKLFNIMDEIHTAPQQAQIKAEERDDDMLEEDEEYEMLEVQEEDEPNTHSNGSHSNNQHSHQSSYASDGDSPLKSMQSSNSANTSPDKDERPSSKSGSTNAGRTPVEEKKLLNTMASATPRPAVPLNTQAQATAASLQKKGITMRRNTPGGSTVATSSSSSTANATGSQRPTSKTATPIRTGTSGFVKIVRQGDSGKTEGGAGQRTMVLESGKTIQLPESIKRKLSEEQSQHQNAKKPSLVQSTKSVTQNANTSPSVVAPSVTNVQVKQEIEDPLKPDVAAPTIGSISIPTTSNGLINGTSAGAGGTSSTAATVASTSTNGYSPRIEDIDFRNDLILDIGPRSGNVGGSSGGIVTATTKIDGTIGTGDIINLGNFDNSLPPTFFKNLCISSRYEAFGLYVANVMNRLSNRSAAKLELGILRAIIDVQSDDLEQ